MLSLSEWVKRKKKLWSKATVKNSIEAWSLGELWSTHEYQIWELRTIGKCNKTPSADCRKSKQVKAKVKLARESKKFLFWSFHGKLVEWMYFGTCTWGNASKQVKVLCIWKSICNSNSGANHLGKSGCISSEVLKQKSGFCELLQNSKHTPHRMRRFEEELSQTLQGHVSIGHC